jgi:hypothetical protein
MSAAVEPTTRVQPTRRAQAIESLVQWTQPQHRQRLWLLLMIGGFVFQVAWRLYLSWPLVGPVAHDDEDAYLFGARMLSGGPLATLPSGSIMRPMGYPLLLAPIYWFVQQPAHVYMGVHIVNSLLMAANFPLLYLFGRRLFHTGRTWTAVVAFVVATLPSLVFFGEFALTDALLPEILMALLLAIHAMFTGKHRVVAGVIAGVVAGYAAHTHVRGLVMLVILSGLVVIARWRKWISWSVVAGTAAAGGVLFAIGYAIDAWLEKRFFPTFPAFAVNGRVVSRLTHPTEMFRVLADGLGQIWYLNTSTLGLAGIGMAAAVWMLWRREGALATRVVLGSALVMNFGIAFATAAGIPDEGRVNNHVYGRYVALFAGVWVFVAIASLARASRQRAVQLLIGTVGLELVTLGIVYAYAYRKFKHEVFVIFDAPELSFYQHTYAVLHFLWVTAIALVVAAAFVYALRQLDRPQWIAMTGLVVLLGINLVAMRSITNHVGAEMVRSQYQPGPAQLIRDAHVAPGDSVAEASDVPWYINQRHQREVYWQSLPQFSPSGGPAGSPSYVVSLASWPGTFYDYQVDITYKEGKIVWIVWRRS